MTPAPEAKGNASNGKIRSALGSNCNLNQCGKGHGSDKHVNANHGLGLGTGWSRWLLHNLGFQIPKIPFTKALIRSLKSSFEKALT